MSGNDCSRQSAADSPRQAVAQQIAAAGSLLLVTHDRPDGDGLGSMVALALAGRAQGKQVRLVIAQPLPRRYAFLLTDQAIVAPDDRGAFEAAERIVVIDTSTLNQLESSAQVLAGLRDKTIVIDHHQTHEDIAAVAWRDASAAATGVMAAELLEVLGWALTEPIAEALMTAICFDTGWLQFSNTDSRALGVVARCLDAGVRADKLHRTLFQNDRPQRMALLSRTLDSLKLHADDRVAVMRITLADFAATGAERDETENFINEPMRIGSVQVSVMLTESDDLVRCSLRSKDLANGEAPIDCAAVAQQFGGGGHARAAGCRIAGTVDQAGQKILAEIIRRLG